MSVLQIKQGTGSSATTIPVEQAALIINQRTGLPIKIWVGSEDQYTQNVTTPDPDTIYLVLQNT